MLRDRLRNLSEGVTMFGKVACVVGAGDGRT